MNVMSVQKPFARSQTSGHIRELTQVRKHTTASNVERLFVGSHTSANIRIFTEEKHYECRKHKSSLDKHHTEETPYDCNECGKTFARKPCKGVTLNGRDWLCVLQILLSVGHTVFILILPLLWIGPYN